MRQVAARSRDGRWTVIPGAYVSRWEPYAEAHEPRQGQPPGGSYGPEECCPDAPPSSASIISSLPPQMARAGEASRLDFPGVKRSYRHDAAGPYDYVYRFFVFRRAPISR